MDSIPLILCALVIALAGLLGLWLLDLIARRGYAKRFNPFYLLLELWLSGPFARSGPAWVRRRLLERIVVGQIASVVRQNLPLATGLALAADSEDGWARIHLRRISKLLAAGVALSDALRLGYPDCSSLVLSLVAAGEKVGQLPAALEQAESYLIENTRRRERVEESVWPYFLTVLTFAIFIVAGMMVAVIPEFKDIFAGFGTGLPEPTVTLIHISEWFVHGTPPGWVLVLLPMPFVAYFCLRPRRFPDPTRTSRMADWIRWHVPGLRRVEFGQGMAAVLGLIRLTIRSGMDLEPAARLAAELDVNAQLRYRVTCFADLLAQGTDLARASNVAGLGQVAATALASGQRAGNLDAALRYAVDYHDAIVGRWWIFLQRLAGPVSTLVLASIVGSVVVALFVPLVHLINTAAGY